MGTRVYPPPILPPVPEGTECSVCWALGKPFAGRKTPSSLLVSFSGVFLGPAWEPSDGDPIDGDFTLDQLPGYPCFFRYNENGLNIDLQYGASQSSIIADLDTVGLLFYSEPPDPCLDFFTNDLFLKFSGGTATISFPETE